MKKGTITTLAILCTTFSVAAQSVDLFMNKYAGPVRDYLSRKPYHGDSRAYTEADLAIPDDVQASLEQLGLSRFSVLRNEIWARHGYVFKTEILQSLFKRVLWYRPDPSFGMGKLTGIPAKNADWIKTLEDSWDYDNISKWLNEHSYAGDIRPYAEDSYYTLPTAVRMSVNHLSITPSRLLRNEIFARKGYIFPDASLNRLFSACKWYTPVSDDLVSISATLKPLERANIAFCRLRENLDILESVTYSLPSGFSWIPTMNYGAIFLRKVTGPGDRNSFDPWLSTQERKLFYTSADQGMRTYHYSSTNIWTALEFDPSTIGKHETHVDELVPPDIVDAIASEPDSMKKIILYFSNKRYKGYLDTIIVNWTDMDPPSYLANSLEDLGIDWLVLLRKEIHARNGAIFSDPKAGPIFRECPWYKPRYNLEPSSVSRFPSNVELSKAEMTNFSLIEGEDLARKQSLSDGGKPTTIVDLSGSVYKVKIEMYQVSMWADSLTVPIIYREDEKDGPPSAREVIDAIMAEENFNFQEFMDSQVNDFYPGC